MKVSAKKRFLAWALAFLMVVTYMPSIAYATDDSGADAGKEAAATEAASTKAAAEVGGVDSHAETEDPVSGDVTEPEETYDEVLVLGGDVLITNTKATGSIAGDIVTITAPGAKTTTPTPNVINIYNKSGSAATVTFDYEAVNYSEFSEGVDSGTYTKTLAADECATLSITGKEALSNNTATLKLSNFTLEAVPETSVVTFSYEESKGSITVDGKSVKSNDEVEVSYDAGTQLAAAPSADADFLGWINKDTNKILSKEKEYTLKPIEDMAVEAVFVDDNSPGYYMAGDSYLFPDLTKAADKAAGLKNKKVVLMNSAVLTGSHVIPAGVTLLIPFDDENTLYTTAPEGEKESYTKPVVYRELTMAKGSSLIVNGELSLSAKHHSAISGSNGGSPMGNVSQITMETGSTITVKDDAALYAYGYITGDGNVDIKSGAVVYECFQFEDWRGGSAALGVAYDEEKHGVFPISQYYVQNIEVPLKLEAGASEYVYTSVNIGGTTIIGAAVEFMGSSKAMFNLEEGNVVKSYDGTTDRLNITAEGTMNLSPITVTMGSNSLNCSEYELPINSNITVEMKSGTAVINQDLALLPGSEIIIDEAAVCKLNTGVSIYVYDSEQWGNYCGANNKSIIPINYAPGKKYTRTAEKDLPDAKVKVNGEMDASAGYIYSTVILDEEGMVAGGGADIYSTGGGKIKTKSGDQKYTYQFTQNGTEGVFSEIRVFPALLTNEISEGQEVPSMMQTWDLEKAGTYTYSDGKWICDHEGKTEDIILNATCDTAGLKTMICSIDGYHSCVSTEEIPAKGHSNNPVKTAAKQATCTEAGNSVYWTCGDCNKIFSDKNCTTELEKVPVINALGHKPTKTEAVAATCTEGGNSEYWTCSTCSKIFSDEACTNEISLEDTVIEARGHSELVHKDPVAKTCTNDGNEEYWYCDACKTYFKDEKCENKFDAEPVVKAGHDMEYFDETPATCTEAGKASGGKCKNCDYTVDAGVISALGHKTTKTDAVAATCTKTGNIEYWTCSTCSKTFSDEECTKEISPDNTVTKASGHKKTHHEAAKATCAEAGNSEYWTCSACNKIFSDEECTKEITLEDTIIKASGHKLTKIDAKAATCTEEGNEEYFLCNTCNKMFEDEECDAEFTKKPVVAALGHTEVAIKAVAPTCTETGLTEGVKCSVCDEILTKQEEVASLGGHKWDKGIVSKFPKMEKNDSGDLEYVSGKRVFSCQNDGCTETKEEAVDWGTIDSYSEFVENLEILEDWAFEYAIDNNIEDPAALVIRYIRTGVDRYNSGSWEIMAGVDNSGFTDYVTKNEIEINDKAESDADKINVTGLKNLERLKLPNGDTADFGHMFGTIDISYTNKNSVNHADVAGFFGDTVDLLSTADKFGVSGTVKEMTAEITEKYFLKENDEWKDKFAYTDMLGDLDGYYINRELTSQDYEKGMLTDIMTAYFTKDLSEAQRAGYYLENRLQCGTSKAAVRDAVYTAYTGNSVVATLEGTRTFNASGDDLEDLRKAACYTAADYICRLAGDYVADVDNTCFTVTSEQFETLAPGITQEIKTAISNTGTNMKYYIATADITRDDVHVYTNYSSRANIIKESRNGDKPTWNCKRVSDQAKEAQETYGNPDSELYIPNYNVVASTNADGYDMTGTERGEPSGLLVMDGEEVHRVSANGFFGILKNGKAVIGTTAEYNNTYKSQVAEAVGGFGTTLIRDGKIIVSATEDLQSRTAVGITATGKVVLMVLDGRQELSSGGDMLDLAIIMQDAGCVEAINLDGGGSSTYVAKQPGETELSVMNNPSDGYERSIAGSLMMVSTAKSSTVFDHATLKTATSCMTVGSELQVTADGVTSTGNAVDIPENAVWEVSNTSIASITKDGKLTALRTGTVNVKLIVDGNVAGQKQIRVVVPDKITFTRASVDVVYGSKVALPIKAYYEGKVVTVNANDFDFAISNEAAGKMDGLNFAASSADTGIRRIDVTASVKGFENISAKITVALYNQGENTFDFDQRTGGDRVFAWARTVSNSTTADNSTYYAVNTNKDMETSYVFAIDMTQIPIPEQLAELTKMLPGSDVEGACAWTYLCNLAQRISDITEVTAKIKIDENFDVDYSKVEIVNDYFELSDDGVTFDKKTNTLTVKLNWIRQYSPIDQEMANPLCLLSGIKLTPKKDADWGANKTINAVCEGDVSYKVYMRASSLVTFASDESNQKKYGLYPFEHKYIDKNGVEQTEAGAGFGDTYNTFTDRFTLVNAIKNGWYVEDGGWRYYEDGKYYTGIRQIAERVDGTVQVLYYDFGEDGVIKGNKKETYSGLIKNLDGTYSYSAYGIITSGWISIDNDWYYFRPDTKKSFKAGKHELVVTAQNQNDIDPGAGRKYETITNTVEYEFDKTGKVLNGGTWFTDNNNKTYFYYGPAFYCGKWVEKDGKKYYLTRAGYLYGGIYKIKMDSAKPQMYYMFDNETYELIMKCEGFVEYNGYTYYYASEEDRESGKYPEESLIYGRVKGLQKIDGRYYLFSEEKNGRMLTGKQTVNHDIEDACTTLTFDKNKGYAVDKNGKARTNLSHKYGKDVHFQAAKSNSSAKYYYTCTECGVKKYTDKQAWTEYVKANTKKTTVKLTASGSRKTESVTLKWTTNTSAAAYYKVQRATSKNGKYKTLKSKLTSQSYTDKTAKVGKTYYYKVTGYSYVGNTKYSTKVSNKDSAKISKTTSSYVKGSSMYASTAYKSKAVVVKWSAPRIKATRYQVYRATSKNGTYKKIATLKYGSTSYTDKNVKVGKRYYYKVRAYKTINGKKVYTKYSSKVSRVVKK